MSPIGDTPDSGLRASDPPAAALRVSDTERRRRWRLVLGGMELREYGEQSMVLRLPVWWGFVVIVPAMGLLVLTCAATLVGHLRRARA